MVWVKKTCIDQNNRGPQKEVYISDISNQKQHRQSSRENPQYFTALVILVILFQDTGLTKNSVQHKLLKMFLW